MILSMHELEGYAGMVTTLLLNWDEAFSKFDLVVEWQCLGLDYYGDTLMERVQLPFPSLESVLEFLERHYGISVTDIPIEFTSAELRFPNPVDDTDRKEEFQENWERFLEDFMSGRMQAGFVGG